VFPVIFALGLQDAVGESTVGALFISLPGAFQAMGAVGRVVGILFFVALFIGAITSAVSLLEVVTSSVIDEWKISRRVAALGPAASSRARHLPASDIDIARRHGRRRLRGLPARRRSVHRDTRRLGNGMRRSMSCTTIIASWNRSRA
jgi:hypothetical protein